MDLDHYYATRIAQERTNHRLTHNHTNPTPPRTRRPRPITTRLRTALNIICLPNRRFQPATTPTR
jgi:hypothetical protein